MSNTPEADNWLPATDAPADLQFARQQLAQLERAHLDEVFAALSGCFIVDSDTVTMIHQNQSYALNRLKQLLTPDHITNEGVGSALLLCGLCETSGRKYATHVLRTGCQQHRERLLAYIAEDCVVMWKEWESYREFLNGNEAFVDALLALLDDCDSFTVLQTIRVCSKLKVPDVADRFLGMLRTHTVTDLQRLALLEYLSEIQLTEEIFDATVKMCEGQKASSGELLQHLVDGVLGKFAVSASEPTKTQAQQCLKDLISYWLDSGETRLKGIGVGGVLDTLCESAEVRDLPWLRRVMLESEGLYPKAPLVALIRIAPEEGRRILFDWLSQGNRLNVALWAARDAYYETIDAELMSALQAMAEEANPKLLWKILNSLRCIGGRKAIEAIQDLLIGLPPRDAEYFRRLLGTSDPTVLLAAIEDSEILHPFAMQKLKAWRDEIRDSQQFHSPNLYDIFEISHSSVSFDLATMKSASAQQTSANGIYFCQCFREVLLRFSTASAGTFCPNTVFAESPTSAADNSTVSAIFSFIHADKLYQAHVQHIYDVGRISRMINAALNDAGVPFRFVAMVHQNQFADFVFARPDLLAPLAQRFHLPLIGNSESN